MATRQSHEREEQSMARSTATTPGNKILPNGDVVNADGEILERGTPEPSSEAEIEATAVANTDAEADPEMLELLTNPAVAWRPEVGDKLIGTIVDRYTNPGTNWGPYEVYEVRTASGAVIAWHAFGTVGKSTTERKNPQPGDRIGVTLLGYIDTGKGNPYANFYTVVRKAPGDGTLFPTGNAESHSA